MFLQIWVHKLASGAIEKFFSHFIVGKYMVCSWFEIILYILERVSLARKS